MSIAAEVAGDVAAAATALSGLLLVFIGTVTAAFEAYDKQDQASVLKKYRWRGWLAFVGFVLALSAAVLSILGKWFESSCLVIDATALLGLSFIVVIVAALVTVGDIQ